MGISFTSPDIVRKIHPIKRPDNLFSHHTLYETSRNAFFREGRSKESYNNGYVKLKGETRSMLLNSNNGFINDLAGGADFWSSCRSAYNRRHLAGRLRLMRFPSQKVPGSQIDG